MIVNIRDCNLPIKSLHDWQSNFSAMLPQSQGNRPIFSCLRTVIGYIRGFKNRAIERHIHTHIRPFLWKCGQARTDSTTKEAHQFPPYLLQCYNLQRMQWCDDKTVENQNGRRPCASWDRTTEHITTNIGQSVAFQSHSSENYSPVLQCMQSHEEQPTSSQ